MNKLLFVILFACISFAMFNSLYNHFIKDQENITYELRHIGISHDHMGTIRKYKTLNACIKDLRKLNRDSAHRHLKEFFCAGKRS